MADGKPVPKGCVYQARNTLNEKRYIGVSQRGVANRRSCHLSEARCNRGVVFAAALRKYGEDVFEWSVLFRSDDPSELFKMEQHFIREFRTKTPYGYNRTDGGEGRVGGLVSTATRLKMSLKMKGRILSEIHKKRLRKPKPPRTAEHAAKIAARTRGRKQAAEALAKITAANRAHNSDPIIRAKISKTLTGRKHGPMSEAQKEKLRQHFKGKKMPPASLNIAQTLRRPDEGESIRRKQRQRSVQQSD